MKHYSEANEILENSNPWWIFLDTITLQNQGGSRAAVHEKSKSNCYDLRCFFRRYLVLD